MSFLYNVLVFIGDCLDYVLGYELAEFYWEFCFYHVWMYLE